MSGVDITAGYRSLGDDTINKTEGNVNDLKDGLGKLTPELELTMPDEEIIRLTQQWEQNYSSYIKGIEKTQKESERYWLGEHYNSVEYLDQSKRPLQDNLIFESVETFLPEAAKKNPEPVVMADNTPEGIALSKQVKGVLTFQADKNQMKLRLNQMTRHWSLYLMGAIKTTWDIKKNDIAIPVVRPQKFILDKDATIDVSGEYKGAYIGEYQEKSASELVILFPKKAQFFKDLVENKMGTKVTYIEWWTPEALFYTYKKEVLEKFRNPHWNYEQTQTSVDEYGKPVQTVTPGVNHYLVPQMPYTFLSVFNLGKQPHDETSLVYQNLSNQDLINTTGKQIVRNVKSMNNGIVLSGEVFTKEQAAEAAEELADGGALWVPSGDVSRAYKRDQAPALPADVFNLRADTRNELRNIFGIRGSSAQGISNEQTVRGKILIGEKDSSRIGGGISPYIEQCADRIFNLMVQFMYVYYDEPHYASILGQAKAQEIIQLRNSDLNRKLTVTVKEGSLIPKDSLTQANQAMDLWAAGAIDPIALYDKLDFPDPRAAAEQLYIWRTSPDVLFPEAAAKIAQAHPPQNTQKPPSESISYKDVPPEAQAQMLGQAGIQIAPQQIQAHNDQQNAQQAALKSAGQPPDAPGIGPPPQRSQNSQLLASVPIK